MFDYKKMQEMMLLGVNIVSLKAF